MIQLLRHPVFGSGLRAGAEAAAWHCPQHALPVPTELAEVLAGLPADACLPHRRHASSPGRVVLRFAAARRGPVSDACRRRLSEHWRKA